MKFKYSKLVVAMSVGLGLVYSAAASASAYNVLDLGNVDATALNNSGQVVGNSGNNAFITGANGVGMTDLTTLGGNFSSAAGINNSGQVVGGSYTASGQQDAFITGTNGVGMTNLGTLGVIFGSGVATGSVATGINDSGQVVGNSFTAMGQQQAFITGANGVGMRGLGNLGVDSSSATGVNNSGQVVGNSYTPMGMEAFITNGNQMYNVGNLGTNYMNVGYTNSAVAINNSGEVVGTYNLAESGQFPFITGANGVGMTNLGGLVGQFGGGTPSGINASGQVVGNSGKYAFITGANGQGMTNLNSLAQLTGGNYFTSANGINGKGQIIAMASNKQSYLLTPVATVP